MLYVFGLILILLIGNISRYLKIILFFAAYEAEIGGNKARDARQGMDI